jgi:hypothetical protein
MLTDSKQLNTNDKVVQEWGHFFSGVIVFVYWVGWLGRTEWMWLLWVVIQGRLG